MTMSMFIILIICESFRKSDFLFRLFLSTVSQDSYGGFIEATCGWSPAGCGCVLCISIKIQNFFFII